MNEKFWDLKKSRQDSMINSALKVFAVGGYRHASTDEIVAGASISKGLLFHYFYSKQGLYEFLAEYSARYALVELGSELRKRESLPFFDLMTAIVNAESQTMRRYPYMMLFLKRVLSESGGISKQAAENAVMYTDRIRSLVNQSVLPKTMVLDDALKTEHYIELVRIDLMTSVLREGSSDPDRYRASAAEAIGFFRDHF